MAFRFRLIPRNEDFYAQFVTLSDELRVGAGLLEEMLGRPTMGHVSKAGPRPRGSHVWPFVDLYDPNIPFVETHDQAKHFLLGRAAFEGSEMVYPWDKPIESEQRNEIDRRIEAEKRAMGLPV